MAEDSLFASDYGSLCRLCDEEGERPCLALGVNEPQKIVDEEAELKREHAFSSINEEKKEEESENTEMVAKEFFETDDEGPDFEMNESKVETTEENKSKCDDDGKGNDVSGAVGPPPQEEKSVLQLNSCSPVNMVMVCEESVENSVNDDLLLCPAKPLSLSKTTLISSPCSQNPLPLTLPANNPSVLQLQTQPVVQTMVQGSVPQAPCLSKRTYDGSPTKTLAHSGQLEVTLQQVYTTRRYTRFTSRSMPLKSVHPETSSQALPCVTNTYLLAPAPKKKTRTSYSTDQLEELERMFQDDHYPDAEKRKEIAISVGVTPQRVMVWFQNRRAKWRKTSKTATKKTSVPRTQAPVQAPIHRPPMFTGPAISPLHPQTGTTLPPYSTLLTSCTSPPGCVAVSQGSAGDYKHPLMQSPPPLRRASLPFFAAYNPPTHTLSVLLDTPEHSEPQSFSLHTDTGFNYDSLGSSAKYETVSSGPGNTQSYQFMTYPQHSSTLMPQQPSTLLSQQTSSLLSQQPNTLLPQYSRVSYLTPSPYLTPNSSEGTATSCLPLNPGTGSLLPCTNGGHAYFQCQNGSQILLQPGLQALQTYPWTGDMYSHSVQLPQAVLKPQFSSHGHESHYPPLVPPQSYITPQGTSCSSLGKPATPDPLLASVKTELEETGHSQPVQVSEAETIFHCDFSPIHF
ncbi:homeobox protein NOBOX-like [Silurus meridionalis]|uniref:homeobox protein NOBOX-like n=1 Tax=Silurus meridionalis TaxID=175797 RepID=UPI001EEA146E|nr:homeobox protein NOBOX-like [Silurus meridionalis]